MAGPTRRNQPHLISWSWRFECIELFKKHEFDGSLIVPEFASPKKSEKSKTQIAMWEFRGLQLAKVILFWIPRTPELIGLTTNCEWGYWMARERQKMIYGRPDDAYRTDYLDAMWRADADATLNDNFDGICDAEIYHTMEDTVVAAIELFGKT